MRKIILVPEIADVVIPSIRAEVLQILVNAQPSNSQHARDVANCDHCFILLEYLEEEWNLIEQEVNQEELLLPPLSVCPLIIDQIFEQKFFIKIDGLVSLDIIDNLC